MAEEFFKEHPVKVLPPIVRKWWTGGRAIRSGEKLVRAVVVLFFYGIGIPLFVGGLATIISELTGLPIHELLGGLTLLERPVSITPEENFIMGMFFMMIGCSMIALGFFAFPTYQTWKLAKMGVVLAISFCLLPIVSAAFIAFSIPLEEQVAILFIIILPIIILLIKT